jgi:hypothetical protein
MIPISMRGFAEVSAASSKSKLSRLKKYRFRDSGESKGRSNYYVKALAAIKHHHRGEYSDVTKILKDLSMTAADESNRPRKIKAQSNLRVIAEYMKHFSQRQLKPLPGKRLYFNHKQLVVSAQPDFVAEEDGKLTLVKFNFTKDDHSGGVISVMLHVLYEAAVLKGMALQPNQVECVQISSGSRVVGPKGGFGPVANLHKMADELIALWSSIS